MNLDSFGKEIKSGITDFKASYDRRLSELQSQADGIDAKLQTGGLGGGGGYSPRKNTENLLRESDSISAFIRDGGRGKGILRLEGKDASDFFAQKTTLTSTGQGFATTGVLPIERIPGITPEARQQLFIRDLLTARPTTASVVDFLKVATPMGIASPAPEASQKAENNLSLVAASEKVRVIATWQPVTRQIMDDLAEVAAFIDGALRYSVNMAEELQILSGDGTGENLHGLIPQASAFQPGLLSTTRGWNPIDIIGHAIQQIAIAKELDATFIAVNPVDWWTMRLLKDAFGRYLISTDPQSEAQPRLFGKSVLSTTNIAAGTFLIGTGSPMAAELRDRLELVVEISSEHLDFFTRNMLAVRAEKRVALCTKRPAAFVTGSFSSSPF